MMLPDFDKNPGVVMMGSKNFDKPPKVVRVVKNESDYEVTRAHMKHSLGSTSIATRNSAAGRKCGFVHIRP